VAAVLDQHAERPAFLFGGRPSEPLASKLRLLRAGVVAACLVAIALAFQAPGEETYRNEVFHRPFVLALAVAAAVAARAAWLRYQADGRSGSLWLVIAFATLAMLYAPHARCWTRDRLTSLTCSSGRSRGSASHCCSFPSS
jgi:hypothetical protein